MNKTLMGLKIFDLINTTEIYSTYKQLKNNEDLSPSDISKLQKRKFSKLLSSLQMNNRYFKDLISTDTINQEPLDFLMNFQTFDKEIINNIEYNEYTNDNNRNTIFVTPHLFDRKI